MKNTFPVAFCLGVVCLSWTLPAFSEIADSEVPSECKNELRISGDSPQFRDCLAKHSTEPTQSSLEEQFLADVEEYSSLPDTKVFALAEDGMGAVAWGYSYGAASVEEGAASALSYCAEQAKKHAVNAECQLIAIGNSLISAPSSSEEQSAVPVTKPQDVVYQEQWVEGTHYYVGIAGELQVWVSPNAKESEALIFLVNGSDTTVTFAPENILLRAEKSARQGNPRIQLEVFGAERYEKKVRNQQAWTAALYGLAAGMANTPQPQTSTYSGSYNSNYYSPGYSNVYGSGTFMGNVTTWPSASDYAESNARTQAQVQAMGSQLKASFEAMAATLMRTHTLMPGSYYGGVVHHKKKKADRYFMTVPFAGTAFEFEFTR